MNPSSRDMILGVRATRTAARIVEIENTKIKNTATQGIRTTRVGITDGLDRTKS